LFAFLRRNKVNVITELAVIDLIVIFGVSLIETIWAVYLNSMFNNASMVGFFTAFLTIIAITTDFFLTPLFQTKKCTTIYYFSLISRAFIYVMFAFNSNLWILIILSVILTIICELDDESFGLLIRKESKKQNIAKNEGLIYTIGNVGWLLGPIFAGLISTIFDISLTFLLATVFIVFSIVMFKLCSIHEKNSCIKHVDKDSLKNSLDFLKEKELLKGFIVGCGNYFWWAMIYVFVPLYMLSNGLNTFSIGIFLFLIIVPLVIMEYKVGKMTDESSYKKMFTIGFAIAGSCAIISFFMSNIYFTLMFLIFASFGLSVIEPNRESYFFKIKEKPKDEAKYYGPYQISYVGNFLGKASFATILLFFPYKFIFLFAGIVMLSMIFVAKRMKV
jgi:MFS transporter, DHA1 family, multidrug resistance protein